MFATLTHLVFQDSFQSRIMLLYSNPSTRVKVNGHLFDSFEIWNGTRQGGLLLLLLYSPTLEPFLRGLCTDETFKGISIGNTTYKLVAFADNVLLFLIAPPYLYPELAECPHWFPKCFQIYKSTIPNQRHIMYPWRQNSQPTVRKTSLSLGG